MNRLDNRLSALERTHGMGGNPVSAICVTFFAPGADGPVNKGIGIIRVLEGKSFRRADFDTEADLIAAANAEHIRVHGKPLQQPEGQAT